MAQTDYLSTPKLTLNDGTTVEANVAILARPDLVGLLTIVFHVPTGATVSSLLAENTREAVSVVADQASGVFTCIVTVTGEYALGGMPLHVWLNVKGYGTVLARSTIAALTTNLISASGTVTATLGPAKPNVEAGNVTATAYVKATTSVTAFGAAAYDVKTSLVASKADAQAQIEELVALLVLKGDADDNRVA